MPAFKVIAEVQHHLERWQKPIEKSIEPFVKSVSILEKASIPMSKIADQIRDTMERSPSALVKLAEYGWYISMDSTFGEIIELGEQIEDEEEEVNKSVMNLYRGKLQEIQDELIRNFPHRSNTIQA
ncbi:MAG: hypothetical protein JKY52_12860 [Flavobacteriales bacterium]|nr:hypothetical protein [Flavobacteriales bacterium]